MCSEESLEAGLTPGTSLRERINSTRKFLHLSSKQNTEVEEGGEQTSSSSGQGKRAGKERAQKKTSSNTGGRTGVCQSPDYYR